MTTQDAVLRFRGLLERAPEALVRSRSIRQEPPTQRFREFAHEAQGALLRQVSTELPRLLNTLRGLARWLVRHDLLTIAGLAGFEDPYTELVAWLFAPSTHPVSALRRQRALLTAMGVERTLLPSSPAEPRTQLWTDDGVPDLVLRWNSLVAVIEAKTGSLEHATPSGRQQTEAYPDAVRRALACSLEDQIRIAFLTPDGRAGANPDATRITYPLLVRLVAEALDLDEVDAETRWALGAVFTHLLRHGAPSHLDLPGLARWAG